MGKTKKLFLILFTLCLGLTTGNACGSDADPRPCSIKKDVRSDPSVLHVYTWEDYIDPEIFAEFEKEHQVKVHVEFFDDENVMYSTVQSEPGRYDVVFPSDSMTEWMVKSSLLSKLNVRNIPNIKHLKAEYRCLISKKWQNCGIPIDWGVTGIAYNTKYVKEPITSWGIFWDTTYKGRTALVNDSYEVMSVGLKYLGYSLNPDNPKDLEKSFRVLHELKPLLQGEGFLSYAEIVEKLKNEELWITQCYNGDVALIHEENNNIKFVIPDEGTSFWIDNVAVPTGAKHKHLAEKFINFMLRPEVGARQTMYSYYASCNKRAWRFIDRKILNNLYVYIDKKKIRKLELYRLLNFEIHKKLNEYWAELASD